SSCPASERPTDVQLSDRIELALVVAIPRSHDRPAFPTEPRTASPYEVLADDEFAGSGARSADDETARCGVKRRADALTRERDFAAHPRADVAFAETASEHDAAEQLRDDSRVGRDEAFRLRR